MKSDLDRLMAERGVDALVVMGPSTDNHPLRYMTGFAKISEGYVVKKRGETPVLICANMEREEGAKSGLPIEPYSDYHADSRSAPEDTGWVGRRTYMLAGILRRHGVSGKVTFCGRYDPGAAYQTLSRLPELVSGLEIVPPTGRSLIDEACMTKEPAEIAGLKSAADRATQSMGDVIAFIKGHAVRDSVLVKADGAPLTVRDVKRYLQACLLERDMSNDDGVIFSIGRDAGIPHSYGEDGDPLMLGKSIIFDLFPRATDTGYWADMTRTFCLGFAPPEVKEAHRQTSQIFHELMESLSPGTPYADLQTRVCDFYKAHGHETIRDNPGAEAGYVHSLGHGVGYEIHEGPYMDTESADVVRPGHVVTIEPGLYYPDRGFGVRIEDMVLIDEKGEAHCLTPFPKDLVIPVGQS